MENMQFRWVIKTDGTKYLQWRRFIAHMMGEGIWSDWYSIEKEISEEDMRKEKK